MFTTPRQSSANAACRRFGISPRRAIPEGLPPSSTQHHIGDLYLHQAPLCVRDTSEWTPFKPLSRHLSRYHFTLFSLFGPSQSELLVAIHGNQVEACDGQPREELIDIVRTARLVIKAYLINRS